MKTRLFALLAALALASAAQAQPWPSKPIRIINGNAPGGSADVTARVVGDVAARALGQPFVIESRPGAGGGIALDAVVRAAPDGYTLLISADSSLYLPLLRPGATINPEKQLTPIVIASTQPLVLAVHSSLGIKTAAELVARAKAAPAPLPYATPSATGTQVVAAEAFFRVAGIKLTNIPYKGGGQAVGDLASGQVPIGVLGSAPLVPHAAAGRIVLLAVSSKNRSAVLPNVPTMAEAGYPGIDLSQWFGILGPAGMQREAVARLSAEFLKALADPEVKQRLATAALEGVGGTPEDMARR
ncbi:MAG: Bug family tripartite tricarboxylate transporter substrate binding protein, partial [Burkholderiales bacterium]